MVEINLSDKSMAPERRSSELFLLLSYCFLASFSSSWNQLFLKSSSEVVFSSFHGHSHRNWSHPLSYFLILFVIIALIFTEYWRQKALRCFGALYVVPIVQVIVFLLSFAVVTGVVGVRVSEKCVPI